MNLDELIKPNFSKRGGLVVVIAQDETDKVLMQAYMNEDAWNETLATGYAVYWSTSRDELWRKGETSGNKQEVLEAFIDCDSDAILLIVRQLGRGACHTGRYGCFYRPAARTKLERRPAGDPPGSVFRAWEARSTP